MNSLPALKIKKTSERQKIEENLYVKNLITSNKLLNGELIDLLIEIKKINQKIHQILALYISNQKVYLVDYFDKIYGSIVSEFEESGDSDKKWDELTKSIHGGGDEMLQFIFQYPNKKIQRILREILKENNSKKIKNIMDLANKAEDLLAEYEKVNKILPLDIMEAKIIYVCPSCNNCLSLNKFKNSDCTCGAKIASITNVVKHSINILPPELFKFIDDNMWLEFGVNSFFKKQKKCLTLCGNYILGYSGVEHEIDNLVDLSEKNLRILIECKCKDQISIGDIFTFSGKMIDLGCIKGFFVTTAKKPEEKMRQLARARNIEIIENIFEDSEKKLAQIFES